MSDMIKHQTLRKVQDRPFGFGENIGGRRIPLEGENVTDAERIASLEDAVRGLHAGLAYVAGEVERLAR